jgi:hypothetical protein
MPLSEVRKDHASFNPSDNDTGGWRTHGAQSWLKCVASSCLCPFIKYVQMVRTPNLS